MATKQNLLLFLWFFCFISPAFLGKDRTHAGLKAAPWGSFTLSPDFTFPVPHHLTKTERVTGLYEIIRSHVGQTNLGCGMGEVTWYENAPSSFCPYDVMKPVFIFSEQRSGTTLLTTQMSQLSEVISFHEPLCCKECMHADRGLVNIPKVLCSLGFQDLGYRTVTLGVQKVQLWENKTLAYNMVVKNNIPSIFLARRNTLARRLSAKGYSQEVKKLTLTKEDIRKVLQDSESQKDYDELYCSLKRAGIRTYFTTYERLKSHFTQTMLDLAEILIGKRKGPWKGKGTPSKGRSPGKTLIGKIQNAEEVRGWLREMSPEKECFLDENCDFPLEIDCSRLENTVFPWEGGKVKEVSNLVLDEPHDLPDRSREELGDKDQEEDIYEKQRKDLAELKEKVEAIEEALRREVQVENRK